MKQNAKSDKPFTLNSHVLERVKAWENLVLGGLSSKIKETKEREIIMVGYL